MIKAYCAKRKRTYTWDEELAPSWILEAIKWEGLELL